MQIGQGVTPMDLDVLGDPQTSGGLSLLPSEDKVAELYVETRTGRCLPLL